MLIQPFFSGKILIFGTEVRNINLDWVSDILFTVQIFIYSGLKCPFST